MKSIERRAYEYAKKQIKPYKDSNPIIYDRMWADFYCSYFCGAKDQKQRMINKIYGWLKTRKLLTEDSLKDLRKAMEEWL